MLTFLTENSITRHVLTLGGITIVMAQLTSWHPWIAGLGTFLVLMVVMALVALRGDQNATHLLAGVSATLGMGVCWIEGADLSASQALLCSVIGTVPLLILSLIVCQSSRLRLQKISDLESQQIELVRKVYAYDRSTCLSGEIPVFGLNSPSAAAGNSASVNPAFGQMLAEFAGAPTAPVLDPDVFDFAMLLLSMQQIGHRLSSELELNALVSAILDTAKEVLRSGQAELHLWSARDGRFTNAAPADGVPVPDSIRDVLAQSAPPPAEFEWVQKQQRILTRRDLNAGKVDAPELPRGSLPAAVAPLLVGSDLIGVLVVNDAADEGPTFVRMLHILANHCALSLKNAQLFRAIDDMARRDSLTGLLNHASFLEELERLTVDANTRGQPLTVVMSDLDDFKSCNDNYGHQAGDRVLQEVAIWWKAIMPDHAVLARYGGEEFICALPGETLLRGIELAEMLRSSLDSHDISHNSNRLHVTASFGVAELGRPANNVARLVRLADKALYRAKNAGRNRVEAHDPLQPNIAAMEESIQFTLR
ncbi:MAG: GGDEF domain-containing protein [Planctomycetaceae bacterium]|nr:GGDEF domain-containing protein [Planctomycetaceae bacterium]